MKVRSSGCRITWTTLPPLASSPRLTLAGVEVEKVSRRGLPDADGNEELFVAGLVLEAGKHPNADRLQLCQVDTGDAEPRQIVCGAWNFGAGDTVAVALPGAVLPDGRTLERAKLRGAISDGMILSERELELSDEHGGILVLGDGWTPGRAALLPPVAGDVVLDFEVLVEPLRPALGARRRARRARRSSTCALRRSTSASRAAPGTGRRASSCSRDRRPRAVPALHRARLRGRDGRARRRSG